MKPESVGKGRNLKLIRSVSEMISRAVLASLQLYHPGEQVEESWSQTQELQLLFMSVQDMVVLSAYFWDIAVRHKICDVPSCAPCFSTPLSIK